MKKKISLLLCVLLVCTMIPALALAEEPEYTYTVVPYTAGPLGEPDDMIIVNMMNEKYNVKFDMIYVESSAVATQLSLMAASGELPDAFYEAGTARTLYEQGVIGTWTEEFFREHCPRISAMLDQYAPEGWVIGKYDGMMYTVPGVRWANTYPAVFAWNQGWLDKLGVTEIPTSLDEVEEVFYRFAKEDPDGNGKDDTYALSSTALQAIYGAFGFERDMWLDDGNGTLVYGDVMPAAKDALELLAKWYADGLIDPEFITGENEGGYWALTHAFINQRIGVSSHGSFYHWTDLSELGVDICTQIPQAIKESANPFKVSFSAPPVGPEGKSGTVIPSAAVYRYCFSKELVNDEERFGRLLDIIDDMMMDIDTVTLATRGIEGVHYEVQDVLGHKSLVYTEGWNDAALYGIGASGCFNWNNWAIDYQLLNNGSNAAFAEHYLEAWRDKAYMNAMQLQLPSNSLYSAECGKILGEGYIAIITGEKPVDYFDEMVEAWNAAGGAILTQEANDLYNK